jgi:organic hydroperoxide reductase OsmC/OhrA
MTTIDKVLDTAKTHTTGRDGASRTSDDCPDVKLSSPGAGGTNPEQLFAAGWKATRGNIDVTSNLV